MSKLDEFIKGQQKSKKVGEPIDGVFACQTCYTEVDEAEYFVNERILKWTCPDNHVSFIEGFSL